jgi:hypothetical protein
MSISGWSFSWRQAADNGPLASTFRNSIFNPVLCPDYILIISLSWKNVNPFLPHAFEHFRTVLFRVSGCGEWAPRLNIQNSYLILFYPQTIFLFSLYLLVELNFNPILPPRREYFRTILFRASGCRQRAPRLNIRNFPGPQGEHIIQQLLTLILVD